MASPYDLRGTQYRGFYNVSRINVAPLQGTGSLSSLTVAHRGTKSPRLLETRSPLASKGRLYIESNVDQVLTDCITITNSVPMIMQRYSQRAAVQIQDSVKTFFKAAQTTSQPNTAATMKYKASPLRLIETGALAAAANGVQAEANFGYGEGSVTFTAPSWSSFMPHQTKESVFGPLAKGVNMNMGVVEGRVVFNFPTAGQATHLPGQVRKDPNAVYAIYHELGSNGGRAFNFGIPSMGRHKGYPRRQWIVPGIERGARGAAQYLVAAWRMLHSAYYRAGDPMFSKRYNPFVRDFTPWGGDVVYTVAPPSAHYSTFGSLSDVRGAVHGEFDRVNAAAWLSKYARGLGGFTKRVQMRGIRGMLHA